MAMDWRVHQIIAQYGSVGVMISSVCTFVVGAKPIAVWMGMALGLAVINTVALVMGYTHDLDE